MVAQVARAYEGKIEFLTSPGQDAVGPMEEFVDEFEWPAFMTHAVDQDGELWDHFKVHYRGAWIFLNQDGKVLFQSPSHIPERQVRDNLDKLESS
jgi:hypothetical protein